MAQYNTNSLAKGYLSIYGGIVGGWVGGAGRRGPQLHWTSFGWLSLQNVENPWIRSFAGVTWNRQASGRWVEKVGGGLCPAVDSEADGNDDDLPNCCIQSLSYICVFFFLYIYFSKSVIQSLSLSHLPSAHSMYLYYISLGKSILFCNVYANTFLQFLLVSPQISSFPFSFH